MKNSLFSFFIRTRFVLFFRGFHLKCTLCSPNATDFYTVLGVSRNANANDIRNAYLKLCKEVHPDANPQQSSATRRFQEINEAYSVLSNVLKRREYDSGRMSGMGSRATSREAYGYYRTQYHRPFEGFNAREEYYKGYESEYERIRRHEEDVRAGRIKPIRTSYGILGVIFGIILFGIVANVMRFITVSRLLNNEKDMSTQQLKEFRRIQNERFGNLTHEERLREALDSIKPKNK